jgi:hypothetical protein
MSGVRQRLQVLVPHELLGSEQINSNIPREGGPISYEARPSGSFQPKPPPPPPPLGIILLILKISCSSIWSDRAVLAPRSSQCGTHKTLTANFWPWLSGKRPCTLVACCLFVQKLQTTGAYVPNRPVFLSFLVESRRTPSPVWYKISGSLVDFGCRLSWRGPGGLSTALSDVSGGKRISMSIAFGLYPMLFTLRRLEGSEFGVSGLGFRVSGLWCRVKVFGSWVQIFGVQGFRAQGSGLRAANLELRVEG